MTMKNKLQMSATTRRNEQRHQKNQEIYRSSAKKRANNIREAIIKGRNRET